MSQGGRFGTAFIIEQFQARVSRLLVGDPPSFFYKIKRQLSLIL